MPEPENTPAPTPVPVVAPVVVAPPPPSSNPADALTAMLLNRTTNAELRVAELESQERTRLAEAARKEQDLLAEKGNTEAAKQALQHAREAHDREMAAERGKLAETDRRSRTAFRDRELALALSGKPLVEGAAPQLMKLMRDAVEAHPEGDGYSVRTTDFINVNDYVARELAKPEYAHFLRATTTGGTGSSGGAKPAPLEVQGDRFADALKRSLSVSLGGAPGLSGNYGRG